MTVSIGSQLAGVLKAIYAGLAAGALYALFALASQLFRRRWVTLILDFLYPAIAGALFAFTLISINGGTLRLYLALAYVLAAILCARVFTLLFGVKTKHKK